MIIMAEHFNDLLLKEPATLIQTYLSKCFLWNLGPKKLVLLKGPAGSALATRLEPRNICIYYLKFSLKVGPTTKIRTVEHTTCLYIIE